MKTSEFIKKMQQLGYGVIETSDMVSVTSNTIFGLVYAVAFKNQRALILNTASIELAQLCIYYSETPLSEREDEKKYTVVLPDSQRRGKRIMALGKLSEYDNEVIILHIKKETLETERCRLTEAEIKRNHEYLWQFAKEVAE